MGQHRTPIKQAISWTSSRSILVLILVLARILVGRAAARHGLGVSFSPQPFPGGAGNGAHLHLSLADADGPVFSGGTGPHGMTPRGAAAVAGIVGGLLVVGAIASQSVHAAVTAPAPEPTESGAPTGPLENPFADLFSDQAPAE